MRDHPLAATAVLLLIPFLVLAVRAVADDAPSPSGDVALIEVRTSDVGAHTPLLGSYQRFGYNHPGPLLFYVLAVPYRLSGQRFAGIEVGALLLGAASVWVILAVAHRRGGRLGLWSAATVVAVFLRAVGPAWLLDPWEPHVLPLVAAAVIVLAFDAAAGRPSALVGLGVAASLVAQAWATMLPLVLAMGAWAAAALVVQGARDGRRRRDAARALAVTAVVLLVLWAPPLYEEVGADRGNLTEIASSITSTEEPLGIAGGWRAVATELGPRASWLGFAQRLDGLSPTLDLDAAPAVPLGAVALVLALVAAWRRRTASRAWVFGATALVAVVASTFAMSRLLGPVFVWIPQWLRVVGMTLWLAAGWCAFAGLPDGPRARVRRILEPVLGLAALGLAVVVIAGAATFHHDPDPLAGAVRRLVAQADLDGVGGPVLATSTADANLALGGQDVALEVLVLSLEDRGFETRVPSSLAHMFGPERAKPGARAEMRLTRADDELPAGFSDVGELDPLSPSERRTRATILERAGLDRGASDADYLRAALDDPALRPSAEHLRAIPDLPPLRLLLRRGAPTPGR